MALPWKGSNVPLRVQEGAALTSRVTPRYVAARMATSHGAARLDLLDPFEVSRLGGLEVVTEGLVEGFLAGLHRSPRRGFSVEFAEHRMYQAGDEPRYVDWKLLGRKDRLYVKQFEEETNLRAMVVLDSSRSMDWSGDPGARLTKFDYARRLAAALALVLLRQRDATGLVMFDDTVRATLPPRVSRAHWMRIAAALGNATPGRMTAAAPALQGVVERLRRRGLVVFVSDLLLDQAPALHALKFLRHRGHSVLVLHVLEPAELGSSTAQPKCGSRTPNRAPRSCSARGTGPRCTGRPWRMWWPDGASRSAERGSGITPCGPISPSAARCVRRWSGRAARSA